MAVNAIGGRRGSRFQEFEGGNLRYATSDADGLPTSYGTPIEIPSGYYAAIHSIAVQSRYNTSGANDHSTQIRLGGASGDIINFVHDQDTVQGRNRTQIWRPRGAMLVEDSIEAQTDAANAVSAAITYELKRKDQCLLDGDLPRASIPFVKGHGNYSTSTYTELVPALEDFRIQIEGITVTGSPKAAGPVFLLLGFNTGSAQYNCWKHTFQDADLAHEAKTFIDGGMNIIGPRGASLDIFTATAAITTDVRVNVYGRYVDHDDVWDETGQPLNAGTITGGSNFWFFTLDGTGAPSYQACFPNSGSEMTGVLEGYHINAGVGSAGAAIAWTHTASVAPIKPVSLVALQSLDGIQQVYESGLGNPFRVNTSGSNLYNTRSGTFNQPGSTAWGRVFPKGYISDSFSSRNYPTLG